MNEKKKRILNIVTVALFLTIIFSLSVMFFVMPDEDFSEQEQRKLTQRPDFNADALFSGEYYRQLNEYFADQFPFRLPFVKLKAMTELALLKAENNGVLLGKNGQLGVRITDLPYAPEGQTQNIILKTDKHFKDALDKEAKAVEAIKSELEKAGIDFALMMPPRTVDTAAHAFLYPTESSDSLISDVSKAFASCNYINLAGIMRERYDKGEYVYYKTDHHWTTYGAYIAYSEIAKQFGFEPYPLDAFEREIVSTEFYGTTYSKALIPFIKPDEMEYFHCKALPPESFVTRVRMNTDEKDDFVFGTLYDRSYLDKKDKYSSFGSGTRLYASVGRKDGEKREKLLIFKDSFANSLTPFLALHYDLEIVNLADYAKVLPQIRRYASDADKVLIIYNFDNLISAPLFTSIKSLPKQLGGLDK